MNKTELIAAVSTAAELSKKQSETAVNAVFDTIVAALKNGEKVSIVGFGAFEAKERAARTGHNPANGEAIEIAASKAPTFKAGKAFKDSLNK